MRALVIGGTGLIGARVVTLLAQLGHAVRVLSRHRVEREGIDCHAGDLDTMELEPVLDGCELVVFAAGADYRFVPSGAPWDFFRRRNVDGVLRLCRAAAAAGARRLVLVSSCYHVLKPELALVHPYVRSLAEVERRVRELDCEMEIVFVQPGYVIGAAPGRPSLGRAIAGYVLAGVPLLAPPGGANLISADGAAVAIARALFRGRPGERYLVGDENLLWTSVFERFADAVGRPCRAAVLPVCETKRDSAAMRNLLYGSAETGVRTFAWSRFVACDHLAFDCRWSREVLGYPDGTLDEGIRECVMQAMDDFCLGSANTGLTQRGARVG